LSETSFAGGGDMIFRKKKWKIDGLDQCPYAIYDEYVGVPASGIDFFR
jgi:hypothetical protein